MASCGSMKQRGMAMSTVRAASDGTMDVVAGRYQSWFLSARDAEPGRPARALWLRHTRHRPAGAPEAPETVGCTGFDPAAGPRAAVKESFTGVRPGMRASF